MPAERANSSASALLNLVEGHRTTAVIHIAAKLAIADLLSDRPKDRRTVVASHRHA